MFFLLFTQFENNIWSKKFTLKISVAEEVLLLVIVISHVLRQRGGELPISRINLLGSSCPIILLVFIADRGKDSPC